MRSGLAGLTVQQGGIFLRRQAIESGFTPREFARMITPNGPWIRIRYGAYTTRELWAALGQQERAGLVDRAALLVCDEHTVLSHSSAARAWDLPLYDARDDLTHVTRIGPGQSNRTESGIKHHLGDLQPLNVVRLNGVRATDQIRTVLDVTAEFGYRSGLVVADAALRQGVTQVSLIDAADQLPYHPGSPNMRAVARNCDEGAETPIETLSRILLVSMGIEDLKTQQGFPLPSGREAYVDIFSLALNHIFECDGRVKYQDQVDDEGRIRKGDEVLWSEKRREDWLRGMGLGFSRIIWRDTMVENFPSASQRLWHEVRSQHARRVLVAPARRIEPAGRRQARSRSTNS